MPIVPVSLALRWLPNAISLLRVPLAALFAVADGTALRLAIALVAGLSDWVDGPLARRTGTTSRTGEWLDPLADKAFMVTALVTLALDARLPLWVLPLLLLRDLGVALGALVLFLAGRRAAIPARRAGKWVTWLQFLALIVLLVWPSLAVWVAPPIALLGAVALADYARARVAGPASGSGGRTRDAQ